MDSAPRPKPPNPKRFWALWLAGAALAAASAIYFSKAIFSGFDTTVFHQTAGGWESVPKPASLPMDIRVSPSGVVWAQDIHGLARLENGAWRRIHSDSNEGLLLPHFVLDGEELWAGSSGGLLHFDGEHWTTYRELAHVASVAAANGQAWTVDRAGNLSHFDGARWQTRKLDFPVKGPKLAATSNGPLWLVSQGLWRFDGKSWNRVAGISDATELLGPNPPGTWTNAGETVAVRGGVWVRDGGEVIGINVDGEPAVRYQLTDLGLKQDVRIFAVAARVPYLALASNQGVVSFDGSRWHFEQPGAGSGAVRAVALGPDGSVWCIHSDPAAPRASSFVLGTAAVILILPLALLFALVWWTRRRRRYEYQNMREAVLHATGSLPDELEKPVPSTFSTGGETVLVLVLGFAGYWVTKRVWPAASPLLLPLYFAAIHIVSTLARSLKKRKPQPSDPIGPGGAPRYDWVKSRSAIATAAVGLLLLYSGSIARFFHIPWLRGLPYIACVVLGTFLFQALDTLRGMRIEREIKQGRYPRALEMLDGIWGWPPTSMIKLIRADALYYSGRILESEGVLNDMVDDRHDKAHQALVFEHLGRVLLARGLYAGARKMFEGAAKLMPNRSAAFSGLAEIRLTQGIEPDKALADATEALRLHGRSMIEKKGSRERLCTIYGNQAWALAMLGRGADAQNAIDTGIREAGPDYKPEVAGLYWRAGQAMLALENTTAAVGHFRKAAEIDPHGYYGKLAAKQLSEHSVWGSVQPAPDFSPPVPMPQAAR